MSKLKGVYPVFMTPFDADQQIDAATLEKQIHWMYDHGCDGIVMAMVSEILRLDGDERRALAALACRFGTERGGVIISVGAESTRLAVRYAQHAQEVGADAVMAIPPVSVNISSDELRRYYQAMIQAIDIPMIIQDASGYVGRPMSIEMQASLLNEYGPDKVLYKPEASPIGPLLSQLRDATDGQARIFEGTGGIAMVDSYQRGIIGTMPGADLCWATVALWRALEVNDIKQINVINGPLCSLVSMLTSLDAFLAVEKHLLCKQGIFKNQIVRGPVGFSLDDETRREVDRLFELLQEAAGAKK